ncbi:MAG: ribosome maturation factor [Lewinellaceae bacterium]|nr:ribosome maturation factor [Lewinellaceae bacterium]
MFIRHAPGRIPDFTSGFIPGTSDHGINRTNRPTSEEKYTTDEVFADCFTVDIELKPGQKLYVFADSDSGMTFEKCQKLSRYLESHLDTKGWLGEKYLLEVSSPGIGRPFKFLRQYRNNLGRNVEVTLQDKTRQTGLLKTVDETQIVISHKVIEREGKKKKEVELETAIPFDQIEKTVVKIAF